MEYFSPSGLALMNNNMVSLTGAAVIRGKIIGASVKIKYSLAYVTFYQGDEILGVLPGTIIRADGVVATCASQLSIDTTKEVRVTVSVMVQKGPQYWTVTCEGALLDADLSSNLAFVKFTPDHQPRVPEFVQPGVGSEAVAVGFIGRGPTLDDTDFNYIPATICNMKSEILGAPSNKWTPGQDIFAFVQSDDNVIGGPLVRPLLGLVGIIHSKFIHSPNGRYIKATPIDEVLKCLEKREQNPKSIAKSFGNIDLDAENAEPNGLHQSSEAE